MLAVVAVGLGVAVGAALGHRASATPPGTVVRLERAVELLRSLAAANAEPSPTGIEAVECSAAAARTALSGAVAAGGQTSDARIVVVVAHGHFVGRMAKVPAGATPPVGRTLLVAVTESGPVTDWRITDWGISDDDPPLDRLGPVVRI
jgi:hypothetical protein